MNAKNNFKRNDLIKLFLIISFPIHLWVILQIFRDIDSITAGYLIEGGVGFAAYVLVYTLVESLLFYGMVLILGLLISRKWSKKKRLVSLSLVGTILSILAIFQKVFVQLPRQPLKKALAGFTWLGSSSWLGFTILGFLIAILFAFPILTALRSDKVTNSLSNLFDRLSVLSFFYLFLDVIAVIILIVRNL